MGIITGYSQYMMRIYKREGNEVSGQQKEAALGERQERGVGHDFFNYFLTRRQQF